MDERRVDNFAYARRAQLRGFLRRLACIPSRMKAKMCRCGLAYWKNEIPLEADHLTHEAADQRIVLRHECIEFH